MCQYCTSDQKKVTGVMYYSAHISSQLRHCNPTVVCRPQSKVKTLSIYTQIL